MISSIHTTRALFSSAIYLLALSISCSPKTTHAQGLSGFTPIPAWGSVAAVLKGQTFLVQGGSNGSFTIPQTFSIDLSNSWDTSNVPYRRLQDGPSAFMHTATLLQDKQKWFVAWNGTGYEYTIAWDSWRSLGGSDLLSKSRGLGAVTDPNTGLIYIPNGYSGNGSIQMARYDVATNILSPLPMAPGITNLVSYSIAWSANAAKMFVFGGADGVDKTNFVYNNMYTWDSQNSWTTVTVKGDVPSARRSACMVPANDGNNMVLFGGQSDYATPIQSDIYILDTNTMTWTKGVDAGAANARADPACAVSNQQLIVWGGRDASGNVVKSSLILVYSLQKNAWQTTYSSNGNGAGTGNNTVNKGAIAIGIVGGFLAILALLVVLFFCRRRRNQKKQQQQQQQAAMQPGHLDPNGLPTSNMPPTTDNFKPWSQQPLPQQHVPQPVDQSLTHPQPHLPMHAPNAPVLPQSLYSTSVYQPPIIHDIQQLQEPPKIFQPHVPSATSQQQALYSTSIHSAAPYSPVSTTATFNLPPSNPHQQPIVYYPRESTLTVLKPEEYQPVSEALTLVSNRHPQLGKQAEGYHDDDSGNRRNPQALPESHPS